MDIDVQDEGQFGETKALLEIFGDLQKGVAVEVGANDGLYGSCTRLFEKRGWDVLLIEPIPELAEQLRVTRRAKVIECACSSYDGHSDFHLSGELYHLSSLQKPILHAFDKDSKAPFPSRTLSVRVRRLDDVLNEAGVITINFITIDVEGQELEVLKAFDVERWQPQVIIVEDNSLGHNKQLFSTLKTVHYKCFKQTGVNFWFSSVNNHQSVVANEFRKMERILTLRTLHRTLARYIPDICKRALPDWIKSYFRV